MPIQRSRSNTRILGNIVQIYFCPRPRERIFRYLKDARTIAYRIGARLSTSGLGSFRSHVKDFRNQIFLKPELASVYLSYYGD